LVRHGNGTPRQLDIAHPEGLLRAHNQVQLGVEVLSLADAAVQLGYHVASTGGYQLHSRHHGAACDFSWKE
jgi:hypothetical protein